jgi:hypothetical protein
MSTWKITVMKEIYCANAAGWPLALILAACAMLEY